MHDADSADWLGLSLIKGLGPIRTVKLLQAFGSPRAVLDAGAAALRAHLPEQVVAAVRAGPDPDLLAHSLAWLDDPANRLITLADPDYPRLLLDTADPPPVLYLKGRAELLNSPMLAVVGSRHASQQGADDAEAFANSLSQAGWTIVSGLALGIDAAAHRGGLAGPGSTLAVVGTGLDSVYPAANHALAHRIATGGALLSEFPLGTPAHPSHFPRRNRLISGMARGVLVVEAALQSGSLITARQAAEQGREVFALPGSIHSTLSKGCHALIKQGAKLVESAADILDELGSPAPLRPATPGSAEEEALLSALGFEPVDLETLCARTNLTVEQAYAMLLPLELAGRLVKLPGGRYQRVV
ncbi:DNA-processing protein DprA [Chitinimonas lacunae]|uniref:DNA-processing protein DprA n=1 Tax=Chitinimonas lacunae TaxID=1963018 RepID=A0ABV8MPQ6_9NEIS